MPKVSIIVPVYNVEKYIEKCIDSIISQTFEDWELILVDDGSPDNSGKICDGYLSKDHRIRIIHKKNEGVSIARNVGIGIAQGEYICFVDSDDWVEPDYLNDMIRYINNDNVIVYGNVVNDYTSGNPSKKVFDYDEGRCINLDNGDAEMAYFRLPENGFPIAKLFRKSIIDQHNLRFDVNLSYHEDHLFVLDYLNYVDTIVLSSKPNYHYMHMGGNNSLSKRKHSCEKLIEASDKLLCAVFRGNKRWDIKDDRYLKRMYTYLGLNQLMLALAQANHEDVPTIASAVRRNMDVFRRYYSPNHRLLKLIPISINWHLDFLYTIVLRWKERFFIDVAKGIAMLFVTY